MKKISLAIAAIATLCILVFGVKWYMDYSEQRKLNMASNLYYGKGVLMDKGKAVDLLKELAEENNDTALFVLGELYTTTNPYTGQDYKKAVAYLRKAADLGNTDAMWRLGVIYSEGNKWIKKDSNKAFNLIKQSAESMNACGIYQLGDLYNSGDGCKKDETMSDNCYKQAFEGLRTLSLDAEPTFGIEDKCRILGHCYYYGNGVEQSYEQAVRWYRKAAELGESTAMRNLGYCYSNGRGVERSQAEADKWYKKAKEAEEKEQ